jgi:hypothetical protein
VSAHSIVGEVEHLESNVHPSDTAPKFEWIDTLVDEVAEQFGPGRLLLA